jgi:hypothetical protein
MGNPFIPEETKVSVTNWYTAAFKKTPLMARYPTKFAYDSGMGYHDDSFTWYTLDGAANGYGASGDWFFWPQIVGSVQQDFWKRGPMGVSTTDRFLKLCLCVVLLTCLIYLIM